MLYVLYTADIIQLVESLQTSVHLYADDTQLYGSCRSRPADSIALARKVIATVDGVSAWMASNRLRLNLDKTQYLWLGSRERLAMLDKAQLAALLPALVESTSARDLGVIIDTELSFDRHVSKLSQSCFFQLRRLRAIRRSLTPATLTTLVHAFVCSRLDFCNSCFYGSKASVLDRMQSILHAAARLILRIPKYGHRVCATSTYAKNRPFLTPLPPVRMVYLWLTPPPPYVLLADPPPPGRRMKGQTTHARAV